MARRLVYGLVALAWVATMGLLVKREILDRRAPGPEAGYASVLTPARKDYQSRMGIYVRGKRWGTAEMYFHYYKDGSYSIDHNVALTMPAVQPYLARPVTAEIRVAISVGADYRLGSLNASFDSSLYRARATGEVVDGVLKITAKAGDQTRKFDIELPPREVITGGLLPFLPVGKLKRGDRWSVVSLDPLSMRQRRALVEVAGRQTLRLRGRTVTAYRVKIDKAGLPLTAWVDPQGEILRATTLFNITLEKEDIPLEEETPTPE